MSAPSPSTISVPRVREQARQGQNGAHRGSHERDERVLVDCVDYLSFQLRILPKIFTFFPGNERLDREKG